MPMKTWRSRSVLILLMAVVAATLFTTSCGKKSSKTAVMTIGQLTNSAPFKATVENVYVEHFKNAGIGTVAYVEVKTDDGRRLSIGGEMATPETAAFIQSLQKGQTYTFPEAFVTYLQSGK